MGSWTIYSKNGVAKAIVKELELHDEWMAECYLTVTVNSATPIRFAVGDYIDYRNERYTIQYDPNVLKKAESGSYGEGFTYDNIKFVGLQDEVVRCDFNDIVLNDNNVHYTALPTFPFYCETVDDLLDRIQANLEELYPGQWIVIGLNTVRNSQRGTAVDRAQAFINAYKQYIDPTGAANTEPYGKQGVAETVDNITCWDAMKKVHDDFGLNFIVRGRVIIVGTAGVFTSNTFRYGKGNGLYEIERIGESDQQIVTRLRAYGSSENLPQHYYATLNKRVYATVTTIKDKFGTEGAHFLLDLNFASKYFTYRSESYPGLDESPNYIIEMKANNVTVKGYVTNDSETGKCYVYCESSSPQDDDRDEPDAIKMAAFVAALAQGNRLDFVDYVKKDVFGEGYYDYAEGHLPDNMAVSRLMLPGFPTQSLAAWVNDHKDDEDKEWLAQAISDGFTFSSDAQRPYIDSPNISRYGIRPASIYFDGSDETENIRSTIEGMTYDSEEIDEVYSADQISDNGVYAAGTTVPNFNITLPDLGFDLKKVYQDGASIDMKNGMCGARSFKMASMPTQDNTTHRWACEVNRSHDESLDLWFPYNDFQITSGDKYLLVGIEMPDAYIEAAAIKLLQASIDALKKNHAPRYTYQPRIDELWMQRQHDTATNTQGVVSLHDTLKAGDIFAFADNDLGIDANVIIDVLTIKENGNNGIPTYEVTLRNEKQIGTIQKITNKVDSIISGDAIFGGSGSMAMQQYQSLIDKNVAGKFLSKQKDDNAEGVITFNKGVKIGQYHSRFLGSGAAIDPAGNSEFESIYSRSFISTPEFRFNRISVTDGEQWCTNGYGTIESVVEGEDENGDAVVNGGLITLHLEENDYASIAEGDICRGIYNDIAEQYHTADMDDDAESAAGSSAQEGDGMGFSSKGGFFTSYFYIERIVKNLRGECQFIYKLRSSTTPHPCAFMKFAQYGSFTNADRRASSYATSIGHYYEMVLEGVKTWQIESPNVVYRKGYLGDMVVELADGTERTLQGYGLYAQNNVYFGSAVIQLDPKTLEMLEDDIAAYDVNISGHVSAIQVDNHGYIIGGIYTDTADGGITTREYRVHSAITVRKNGVLLTEALPSAEAGKGTYKITCSAVDCSYVLDDSTIYLTHIDNLLNLPTDDPSDYDPEVGGLMERCRIDIVVDCEGKTSIQKSIVIAINHDGMDGKGVEYIFITKETWDGTDADKPTIYDVADDRQVDDYCPYTDAQHTDQWTDEPTGVSDNQRFEFYAQRKQINGIWQPFGEVKLWNRYVVDGVTPYLIDLSNEQSMVACNENGGVVGSYETSRLMLFYGHSYAFTDFAITITPTNISCNGNSSAFTLTSEQKATAQATGYFTLTPSAITADSATIAITATKENVTLSAVYKINKAYAGKNGVIYSLMPSLDTIRKNKSGTLVDSTLTLQVKKTVGATATILTTYSQLQNDGLSLQYQNADGISALSDVSIATSTLIGSGLWGKINLIKSSIIVDSERLNVVVDGNDGAQGKYEEIEYAIGDNRSTAPSSGWSSSQPSPTPSNPYVWRRSRVYNPATGSYSGYTYVCLTGSTGATGPMYYLAGIHSSDKSYSVTSQLVPVVCSSGSNPQYYYAKENVPTGIALSNDRYWAAFSNFAAAFIEVLFANFAKLGAFIINGNLFFSQMGTINGDVSTDYTNPNFQPYLKMNAENGYIYARRGTIGGFEIGDETLGTSYSEGTVGGTYIRKDGYMRIYNVNNYTGLSVIGGAELIGATNKPVSLVNNSGSVSANGNTLNLNTDANNNNQINIGNASNTQSVNINANAVNFGSTTPVSIGSTLAVAGVASLAKNIISGSGTKTLPSSPKIGEFYFCKGTSGDMTIQVNSGTSHKIQLSSSGTEQTSISLNRDAHILVYMETNKWVDFKCN